MYPVSNDYKAIVHGDVIKTRLTFEIDGTTYTDDNILQGSLQMTNQCTDTKDVKVGAVYVGELSATFRNVNVARNAWRGKEISLTFYMQIDEVNDTWEDVPLGVYTVSEAQWKASGVVVKAFDNMSKFDKPLSLGQTGGKLYDFLVVACTACNVTLAQTQAQIEALPNGNTFFSYYNTNDVQTWRDLISYIAAMFGGFATINRAGELEFRTYSQSSVDTLTTSNRHTNGAFSDYLTKYTALTYTHIESKEQRRYAQTVDDGATMDLGANPFLQNKLQSQSALPAIMDAVALIRYTPFNVTTASNPAFDLGDVISCTGGIAGASVAVCCVQKIVFNYHRMIRLQGFGADPALANAKSKTDKSLAGMTSASIASDMGFYESRNIVEAHINDGTQRRMLNLRMASNAKTRVHLHININLESEDTDDNDITRVIATYYVDSEEISLKPEETYIDGKHVLHLMYVLPMLENSIRTFTLFLSSESGNIFIAREGLWAYASGAGLVGDGEWDGNIDVFDYVFATDIPTVASVATYTEDIEFEMKQPVGANISENISVLNMYEPTVSFTYTGSARIISNYTPAGPRLLEDSEDVRVLEDSADVRFTEERF